MRVLDKLALDLPRRWRERAAARGPLPEPTSPADGGRGALPPADTPPWDGAAALAERVAASLLEVDWGACPATGAHLPQQHRAALDLDAGAWHEARLLHRHAWFSTLARAWADTGDARFAVAATESLASWLAFDRPRVGIGWVHGSDAAERVLHWVAGAAWLGEELDADLWRRMAGSVGPHAELLRESLPSESDFRVVGAAAGLVAAGLAWPELPGARGWWSEGLALLKHHLPAMLHGDGVPRDGSAQRLQRTLGMVLVARRLARANGVAFPGAADHAFSKAAWVLRVLAADSGHLPAIGASSAPLLAPWGRPTAYDLWDAIAADRGAAPSGSALAASTEWTLTAFREGGWIALHSLSRGSCSRVVVSGVEACGLGIHADVGQVTWTLDEHLVLADPGDAPDHRELARAHVHNGLVYNGVGAGEGRPAGASLRKARSDGRTAAVAVGHASFAGVSLEREVQLEGDRMMVVDRLGEKADGAVELRFTLGPGWALEEDEKQGWTGKHTGGRTLVVKLDEQLRWTLTSGRIAVDGELVSAPVFHGVGQASGRTRIRNSFELR